MSLQYKEGQCCKCLPNTTAPIVKRLPSGNYCHKHNQERLSGQKEGCYPKQKIPRKLRRKPTGEKILFDAILSTRKNVSFLTEKALTSWDIEGYKCCAHVLSKNKYPMFRLNDTNIILLTQEEHNLLDAGTEEQRERYAKENNCSWEVIYGKRKSLERKYFAEFGGEKRYH